jgi:hypothetical protein
MAHFQKLYYALNRSSSKNILISLVHNNDGSFSPLLHIYGGKDEISMSLRQYNDLYAASENLFNFLDARCDSAFLDLSNDHNQLFVTGRRTNYPMVIFKQVEQNHTNVICIAKNTLEKLLELRGIVNRLLLRYEKSMPDIIDVYRKQKAGEQINDKINMYGFDLALFGWELKAFSSGVTDDRTFA